jgi:iron complex transport system ATP-binding protein
LLHATEVSFRYRPEGPRVLDRISLEVRPGEVVGLLGPNGSGKTTLLRLLSGVRTPTTGVVRLDGEALSGLSRRAVAQRVAVVPQGIELAFDYTVLDLVLMGRHPHLGPFAVEGPADYAHARAAMAATGIAALEDRLFRTLSGGEQQRVIIAAALAQQPQVLLLDEPTTALDLGAQLDLAALLRRLNTEHGVTLVISTHDLHLAASVCDRIALLKRGRLVGCGAVTEMLTPDHLRTVFDVEADVLAGDTAGTLTIVPIRRHLS